jgi:hypothetical protein
MTTDCVLLADQPDPDGVLAVLQAERVAQALLLELQFASGPVYLSNLMLPFVDLRWGRTWQGLGAFVLLEDMQGGKDNLAPARKYTLGIPRDYLTGDETTDAQLNRLPTLVGSPGEYRGREAILYMQLFGETLDAYGRVQAAGYPIALDTSIMDSISVSYSATQIALSLSVESFMARKGYPSNGTLTYRDQLQRHAGDTGLGFVPEVAGTIVTWPKFS